MTSNQLTNHRSPITSADHHSAMNLTGELLHELLDAKAAVRFLRFDRGGDRWLGGAYDATMRVYRCGGPPDEWVVTDEYRRAFQWERSACFTGPER